MERNVIPPYKQSSRTNVIINIGPITPLILRKTERFHNDYDCNMYGIFNKEQIKTINDFINNELYLNYPKITSIVYVASLKIILINTLSIDSDLIYKKLKDLNMSNPDYIVESMFKYEKSIHTLIKLSIDYYKLVISCSNKTIHTNVKVDRKTIMHFQNMKAISKH